MAVCVPPSITTQPISTRIDAGGTPTHSVVASGESLIYQWYQGAAGDTSTPLSGATSSTYTTAVLNATGSYWVQATNPAGDTSSSNPEDDVWDSVPQFTDLIGTGQPVNYLAPLSAQSEYFHLRVWLAPE